MIENIDSLTYLPTYLLTYLGQASYTEQYECYWAPPSFTRVKFPQ